jgi:hypothetical protein
MSMLYGGGRENAFIRLQEATIKNSNDLSLFRLEKHHLPTAKAGGCSQHHPQISQILEILS